MKNFIFLLLVFTPLVSHSQEIEDLWTDVKYQKVQEVELIGELRADAKIDPTTIHPFLSPRLIRVSNGEMLLYDFNIKELYRVQAADLTNSVKIGEGQGRGPGEYEFIGSIGLDDSHRVYGLDTQLLRLNRWNNSGDDHKIFDLKSGGLPGKLAVGREIVVKYSSVGPSDNLLGILDKDGNLEKTFYSFNNWNGVRSPMLYEGQIAASDDHIVYASSNFGVILGFDYDGNLLFERGMIEPINGLKMEIRRSGSSTSSSVQSGSLRTAEDIEIYDDRIYVLYSGKEQLFGNRIDLYDIHSGDYIGSYQTEENLVSFSIDNEILYGLAQDEESGLNVVVHYYLN
ncbi:hypothetical protein BH23BAC3_BH23BAC3_17420 [soil metagenome]